MTSAESANARTATLLPGAAARTISAARVLARSNWPGADMLTDVSTSTIVAGVASACRRLGQVGPGEREREQQQRGHAQRQEQHFPQPPAAGLLDRRAPQEPHRAELDHRLGAAMKQMNRNWNGGGGDAEQKQRREKGQPEHYRALPRVDRYDISANSSGLDVSSRR